MLLAPFLDYRQRILDVFLRVGIGVGVKNLSLRRNHIGNAVGEERAHKRNVKPRVIGLDNRKAGVGAHREFVAALLGRKVALHLDLVARKSNDARAGRREILDVFGKFMSLDSADARERFGIKVENHRPLFQGLGEGEREVLASQRGLDGEIGRGVSRLQRRPCSGCEEATTKREEQGRRLHWAHPFVSCWSRGDDKSPTLAVQATHNATPDQINADWWGRTTRLTNAFSKKAANHAHMMAIYFMHDNFAGIRQPLEVTPEPPQSFGKCLIWWNCSKIGKPSDQTGSLPIRQSATYLS
jgi:hypothetical protein